MHSLTKPIISISILCLAFAVSYAVRASAQELDETITSETATSTEIIEATPPVSEDRLNTLRQGLAEITNRPGVRISLSERAQERIINLASNISNRMDATVNRFEQIIKRLERRIEKSASGGIDVESARNTLEEAKVSLAVAKAGLTNIDTAVIKAVTSDQPQVGISNLATLYRNNVIAFRDTKRALQETIALLKNPTRVVIPTSTSTEAVLDVTQN